MTGLRRMRISSVIITGLMRSGIDAVFPIDPLPADARLLCASLVDRGETIELVFESAEWPAVDGYDHAPVWAQTWRRKEEEAG